MSYHTLSNSHWLARNHQCIFAIALVVACEHFLLDSFTKKDINLASGSVGEAAGGPVVLELFPDVLGTLFEQETESSKGRRFGQIGEQGKGLLYGFVGTTVQRGEFAGLVHAKAFKLCKSLGIVEDLGFLLKKLRKE